MLRNFFPWPKVSGISGLAKAGAWLGLSVARRGEHTARRDGAWSLPEANLEYWQPSLLNSLGLSSLCSTWR